MGIFDKIKKGTGLNYLETESPKQSSPTKSNKTSSSTQDRELKAMESKIQNIINQLQEIQEKLRVRRGI